MNKQQYEVNNLPTQIVIGHQTETGVTSIYFDCTSWLASWPDLVLGVWVTQPGGTAAYPAATHMEGDVLVWDVTDSDTAVPGTGTMEIVGIASGKKKLSAITKTLIQRTTTGTATEPPEGAKAWVDSVMQAANDAETSKSQAATYAQNAAASAEKAEENAKSVTWETLSGKPSTFPPDSHTHTLESLGAASAESVNQLKGDISGLSDAIANAGGVKKVSGVSPDSSGNVPLTAADVGALPSGATAADSSKLGGQLPEFYATAVEVDPLLYNNAGAHNAIYRGMDLGNAVTGAQWAAISAGTFEDLYIGDYWTIGDVTYRIAAFDYYLRAGDTDMTTHHVTLVPDGAMYNYVMNDSNVTTGGYVGSKMYTTGLADAKTTINNAFGSAHILTHRQNLCNAVKNGKPSGSSWYDSTVELMTEQNVYGGKVFGAGNDGSTVPMLYTVDKSQYPLFAFRPDLISNRNWLWLRDVVSGATFACVYYYGAAAFYNASRSGGVRPAFSIC